MAGVKGRSGRRPLRDEEKRLKIIDKAWNIVDQLFDDPSIPPSRKIKEAIQIIVKDMPQEVSGMDMKQVLIMGEIKKGQESLRYNIGTPDPSEDPQHT